MLEGKRDKPAVGREGCTFPVRHDGVGRNSHFGLKVIFWPAFPQERFDFSRIAADFFRNRCRCLALVRVYALRSARRCSTDFRGQPSLVTTTDCIH